MSSSEILELLRAHAEEIRVCFRVRSLSVFGSVARGEADENSDIDCLVAFVGPADFDGFMELKAYLEDLTGRRVDLVTDKALRPRVRKVIAGELLHVA